MPKASTRCTHLVSMSTKNISDQSQLIGLAQSVFTLHVPLHELASIITSHFAVRHQSTSAKLPASVRSLGRTQRGQSASRWKHLAVIKNQALKAGKDKRVEPRVQVKHQYVHLRDTALANLALILKFLFVWLGGRARKDVDDRH